MHDPHRLHTVPLPAWRGRPPLDVAGCWPASRRLVMLHSGRREAGRSRWSIMAVPVRWLTMRGGDAAALRRLDAAVGAVVEAPPHGARGELPFCSGWIGALSYELGRDIEPAVRTRRDPGMPSAAAWPAIIMARCDAALVHDAADESWHATGREGALQRLLTMVERLPPRPRRGAFSLGAFTSRIGQARFEAMVARTVEYIRAGDIFQANITRLLRAPVHGSRRALGMAALGEAAPWFGAYLELPGRRTLISLSPELFLEGDRRDGRVLTRPVKGTRPAADDPEDLLRSAKDEAELVMIVDLMRNDLGRVCATGSITVSEPRHVETHPTVHHTVAGISGRVRAGITPGALLAATFPPGSITGAPKIRAMQIIESLEPEPRGPYCGAVGFFADHGPFAFNVAIRTLALAPTVPQEAATYEATYGVGCGIVADSQPEEEWRESEVKAAIVRRLVDAPPRAVRGAPLQSPDA